MPSFFALCVGERLEECVPVLGASLIGRFTQTHTGAHARAHGVSVNGLRVRRWLPRVTTGLTSPPPSHAVAVVPPVTAQHVTHVPPAVPARAYPAHTARRRAPGPAPLAATSGRSPPSRRGRRKAARRVPPAAAARLSVASCSPDLDVTPRRVGPSRAVQAGAGHTPQPRCGAGQTRQGPGHSRWPRGDEIP